MALAGRQRVGLLEYHPRVSELKTLGPEADHDHAQR